MHVLKWTYVLLTDRYMKPLRNQNWEGVEEEEYWAMLRGDKATSTKLG